MEELQSPGYLLGAIQVQQLKAARFVCGYRSFYWSTQKLLKTCGWLSVRQQEFYSTSLMAHKIATTNRPQNLSAAIFQPYKVNTRAAAQGQIRYANIFKGESELVRTSFKHRAMKYYNSLPFRMKQEKIVTFKASLKKYATRHIPLR